MIGMTQGGAGAGNTSGAPPSPARLQPGQRVGGDVYGFAVAICRPSRPGADIWPRWMGGRVWVPGSGGVSSISGLAGLARPNHAQEAPTKEVMQLLVQLLPPPSPRQLQEEGGTCATRSAEGKPGKHVRR